MMIIYAGIRACSCRAGFDQLLKLFVAEPVLVAVAGVAKTLRQLAAMDPVAFLPPGMGGLDDVHLVQLHGIARFIFREQNFVQFFSRANADALHRASGSDGFGEIDHAHAGNFRHKDFAAVHLLDGSESQSARRARG